MVTYQERKANTKVYVLRKDNEIIGVYGNLKKLCELANYDNFPSYWTLTRKKEYPIEQNGFVIDYIRLY